MSEAGPLAEGQRPPAGGRSTDLQLARVHLRLGSLALARAELETLAGRDALDDDGLVDLAEVRWRTGDLTGAGEAAHVVLGDRDGGPVLALVVAAEAAMDRGRPTESRRLAERALASVTGSIDEVFAGMPRAAVWPADPADLPPPEPTLFDVPAVGPASDPTDPDDGLEVTATSPELASMALWDELEPDGAATVPALPSADAELDRGRDALAAGRDAEAAVHLALVLRSHPAYAPAVLDLVASDRSSALAFVRGDAYRLVGREAEALRAYAMAVIAADGATDPEPTPITRSTTEGDPA